MIKVRVKFFAYFRELFGAKDRELLLEDGLSLAGLLRCLAETRKQKDEIFQNGRLNPQVVIMLNGSVVNPEQLEDIFIKEGDQVAVFPMMGGG